MQTVAVSSLSRRRWTMAPLRPAGEPIAVSIRATTQMDDPAIAALLGASYVGTIDFDPDADHVDELMRWRQLDEADDEASVLALSDGELVGASLIARELGTPFLYEIVVAPQYRRGGIARALLARSISVLAHRGEEALSAWVTHGNRASESLLADLGFVCVTPPVNRFEAIRYYRAAGALGGVDQSGLYAVAVSVEDVGPTLWVFRRGGGADVTVDVRDMVVRIVSVDPDDPGLSEIASRSIPIKGAPWLLSRRGPSDG
jgi:GNAT superfamily N-acetyltransferase